ncbi:flagellar motor switch protein FliN [Lachnospiraceae bacterium 62-35]
MGASSFNEMELDAIGEIMNISLGASATAVSTMLGTKVNITTPVVMVQTRDEFEFKRLEPAIGVEIAYVEGLEGKNIMMFRREDVRIIVGTLMGEDPAEMSLELDEIYISAICEVMNQMMGASATALSEFLGTIVNISTPVSFDIGEPEEFKAKYFSDASGMVVVRFHLEIEGKLNSEFMNIMSVDLTKRLLAPFEGTFIDAEDSSTAPEPQAAVPEPVVSEPEPQVIVPEPVAPEPQPVIPEPAVEQAAMPVPPIQQAAPQAAVPVPPQMPEGQSQMQPGMAQAPYYAYPPMGSDPMMIQLLNQMQQTQMQMMEMMKNVKSSERSSGSSSMSSSIIRPLSSPQMQDEAGEGEEDKTNQEMLMKVPLEISVEIGRTKRLVRDILEFTQGTLVVLDKMAGEQVDLFVNGQCIARGDIVVVEDNFGIRITEIVSKELNPESL